MFYAYTHSTPLPKPETAEPQTIPRIQSRLKDIRTWYNSKGWIAISSTTGGWCLLKNEEHAALQELISLADSPGMLATSLASAQKDRFLWHLYNCRLLGDSHSNETKVSLPDNLASQFSLTVVLSDRCNLACRYCYFGFASNREIPQSSRTNAHWAIQGAFECATDSVLIDFGEIAMDFPIFCELVQYAETIHQRYPDKLLAMAIQTNGTTLSSRVIDFLEQHEITVGISLDGPRDLHDAMRLTVRGRGSQQRVVQGLRDIINRKMKHIVLCTVSSANVDAGPDIVDYFLNMGVSHFSFKPVMRKGSAASEWQEVGITVQEYCNFLHDIADYAIRNRNFDALDDRLTKFAFRVLGDPRGWSDPCPSSNCGCGTRMLVLSPAGIYYPCPRYSSVTDDYLSLGRDFAKARSVAQGLLRDRIPNVSALCSECLWLPFCQGGCLLAGNGNDPASGFYRSDCVIYRYIFELLVTQILPTFDQRLGQSCKHSKLGLVKTFSKDVLIER